jgi:glycosyltransferase involved in cell wall biosynthesis
MHPMPPRIVLDARLLHYNQTGIGRYLRHLYAAVAEVAGRDGLPEDAQLVVAYHRKDRERALARHWHYGATLHTPAHHRLERWALAAELVRLRPALVHSPDHVCPLPLGWRVVLTVHDLAFWRLPETHDADSRAHYAGLTRSVQQAARVICVSRATRDDLIELTGVDPGKVRVVHEAADPVFHVPPGRPACAGERPFFVMVGTISPRKNVDTVIRAMADLLSAHGGVDRPELVIVGSDGVGAAATRALPAQLGIGGDVRFVGPQPAGEVAALYHRTLALLYPSLLEGFGLPILEAMACGAPVVTSNRSSMPEVAGDAAVLVDPDDVGAIAGAMRRLVEDAGWRASLGARGRARETTFSWERAARETLAVFGEALAG